MSEHPINGLMETTMKSIKEMIDVNTIVGDAVETVDGTVIIPISKVTFGVASGGSQFAPNELSKTEDTMFGGGSGAGVSIKPMAFMVVGKEHIKLLPVVNEVSSLDKAIDYIPDIIDKITDAVSNKTKKEESSDE